MARLDEFAVATPLTHRYMHSVNAEGPLCTTPESRCGRPERILLIRSFARSLAGDVAGWGLDDPADHEEGGRPATVAAIRPGLSSQFREAAQSRLAPGHRGCTEGGPEAIVSTELRSDGTP
jgi:hypothetical protein